MAAPTVRPTGSTTGQEAAPWSTRPAPDGTPLLVRHWPAAGDSWATVLIVHGIGEHSGRYERTGRLMAGAGLDVYAFDLRGHGLSGGRRVYVHRWDDFLDDLAVRLTQARQEGRPLVLLGHSMGALIALTYVCSDRPAPDLLVANPIAGDQLSRDPEVGIAYFADPLVQPRSTARLGAELLRAMKRARSQVGRLHVPTLVIHGGADTLVPTAVSEPLAGVAGVERRVLPNLRHEVLNEPEGPEVVATIVEWLRSHLPAPSG
jgi:alpha-beta hydrolase superfamily lysophospholipase